MTTGQPGKISRQTGLVSHETIKTNEVTLQESVNVSEL